MVAVIGHRPVSKGVLHDLYQARFGRQRGARRIQPLDQVVDLCVAQAGQYGFDVLGGVAFFRRHLEAEFLHRLDIAGVVQGCTMRIGRPLEFPVALPLQGVADDNGRPAVAEPGGSRAVGVDQLPEIVAVRLDDVPAERRPQVRIRRRHSLRDRPVDPEGVVVQSDDQILDAESRGDVARFVGHALFGLGISGDREHSRRETARAVQRSQPQARRNSVPRRPRADVGEGILGFHVPAGPVQAAEAGQVFGKRERRARSRALVRGAPADAFVHQGNQRMEQRTTVPCRPDDPIAPRMFRVRGIESQHPGSQKRQRHLGLRGRSAGMAGPGAVHRRKRQSPNDAGESRELLLVDPLESAQGQRPEIEMHAAVAGHCTLVRAFLWNCRISKKCHWPPLSESSNETAPEDNWPPRGAAPVDPRLSVGSARPAVFRSSTYVFSSPEAAQRAFDLGSGRAQPAKSPEPGSDQPVAGRFEP